MIYTKKLFLFLFLIINPITSVYATCIGNTTKSTCEAASPAFSGDGDCNPWGGLVSSSSTPVCVFNTSNSSCCKQVGCVLNAYYNGTNCVCNNTYYYDSPSNTCKSCPTCTVINGSATPYTANNHCAYNITCQPGYEVTFDRCSDFQAATCSPATYGITLNDSANGGSGGMGIVREVYGTKWVDVNDNEVTHVTIPVKSNYIFTGYYLAGNEIKIPANGLLPVNTTFENPTTLYANFEECPTIAGTNGTVYQIVSNNTCGSGGYYIVCNAGFQNTSNYDESHPSASSSLSCSTCSAGYYCPGGTRQQCPSHTTSYAGADESTDCHAAPGYYKQTPTSSVTPCTGGMTSDEASTSLTNCYYKGGASGTKQIGRAHV